MIVRTFRHVDEQSFLELVNAAYRNLETLTAERVKALLAPPYFHPEGFFIAEEKSAAVGCVGVFDLAVKDAFSNRPIVNSLIEAALDHANSKKCAVVKAVILTIQPYIDAYRRFGFKPIRRILRIAWDPIKIPEEKHENRKVALVELSEDDMDEASHVFVEGLQPYWD
jgi:ribosomal protein S18 acetylase RimI-like enzyme